MKGAEHDIHQKKGAYTIRPQYCKMNDGTWIRFTPAEILRPRPIAGDVAPKAALISVPLNSRGPR